MSNLFEIKTANHRKLTITAQPKSNRLTIYETANDEHHRTMTIGELDFSQRVDFKAINRSYNDLAKPQAYLLVIEDQGTGPIYTLYHEQATATNALIQARIDIITDLQADNSLPENGQTIVDRFTVDPASKAFSCDFYGIYGHVEKLTLN